MAEVFSPHAGRLEWEPDAAVLLGAPDDALAIPGMDPYLEAPDIWPDFHLGFACATRGELNQILPEGYYVDIADRPYSPADDCYDVAKYHYLEIRESKGDHKLITLIEILSPEIKSRGPDRDAYLANQHEVLGGHVNLIELDLRRHGNRVLPFIRLDPPADYVVLVNRAWRRTRGVAYQIIPFSLHDRIPCIPVPLKEEEAEVPLDLQSSFNRNYEGGPYRRGAVNYAQPPDPPLSDEDAGWAEGLIRAASESWY